MLPKIAHPSFKIEIPSTKKRVSFRPFLVKEEKVLLMAKTSEDPTDILTAVKNVVSACCVEDLDIDSLAIFDLEYIFLKIRANSVSNKVSLIFQDTEDNKEYKFEVNLDDVKVVFPPDSSNKIVISDEMGIIMKYPPAALYDDRIFLNLQEDALFELIVRCIDKIYIGDVIHEASSYKSEEIAKWLDDMDSKTFEKIQLFLNSVPRMQQVLEYKNSLGHDRKIELNTLLDFFTLR
jgi:hypothetical protein